MADLLSIPVDELELSVRSSNCLKNEHIVTIGELIQKSENEMLRCTNFGRRSLEEMKGLRLRKDYEYNDCTDTKGDEFSAARSSLIQKYQQW